MLSRIGPTGPSENELGRSRTPQTGPPAVGDAEPSSLPGAAWQIRDRHIDQGHIREFHQRHGAIDLIHHGDDTDQAKQGHGEHRCAELKTG